MAVISAFQVLSLACLWLFLCGILNNFFTDTANYCEMTYMFEYPQFVKIHVPGNENFAQYGLYAYSEGRFTEKARRMKYDGVPVLFLPGNCGSHQQVRSIASVALRRALSKDYELHFDYFTIDFNEELSALFGGVLKRQTNFASMSLHAILNLYKSNSRTQSIPTSVIVIGHSMGGLIAKGLAIDPQNENAIRLILTLASPVEAPVMNIDAAMSRYYMTLHEYWKSRGRNAESKVVISIGSGFRDILVPSGLASSADSNVSCLATAIPGVWVSTDHLNIVWCKQLNLAINRFLFSILNRSTRQITKDNGLIISKAKYYFKELEFAFHPQANRTSVIDLESAPTTILDPNGFWYEDSRRIYQIDRPNIPKIAYLMIRLISFPQNRFAAVQAINHDDKVWVFGCNAKNTHGTYRVCNNATDLTEVTRWTPAVKGFGRRKLATIDLHEIIKQKPEWSHIIVKTSPTRKPVTLNVDINDKASRTITVTLPAFYQLDKQTLLASSEPGALYYELVLPGLEALHQAYHLHVEPEQDCQGKTYLVTAEMLVPWAEGHETYHFYTSLKRSPMRMRLLKAKPGVNQQAGTSENVSVTLLLDPKCTFSVSISTSLYDSLGQLSRHYSPLLASYVAAVSLLALRHALLQLSRGDAWPSFHSALCSNVAKPYYVLVSARLGTTALMSVPAVCVLLERAGVSVCAPDGSLLWLWLYLVSLGVVHALAAVALVALVCASQLAHRMLLRVWFGGGRGGVLAEKASCVLRCVPGLVAVAMVASVPASCGAATLAVGAAFYYFMLSKMYEEYLEDFAYKLVTKLAVTIKNFLKAKTRKNKNPAEPTRGSNKTHPPSLAVPSPAGNNSVTDGHEIDNTSNEAKELTAMEANKLADRNIPTASDMLLSHKDLPKEGNSLPHDDETVPEDNKVVPQDGKVVPEDDKVVSQDDKVVPQNDKVVPEDDKVVPPNEEVVPQYNKIVPNDDEVVPQDNKVVPQEPAAVKDKDEKRKSRNCSNGEEGDQLSGLHFHTAMFFLWCLVSALNIPVVLSWARNFRYNMILDNDTSYYPGLLMSVSAGFLWQIDAPRKKLKYYELISQIIFIFAVLVIILAPTAPFFLNYILSLVFALITLQQCFDSEIPAGEAIPNADMNPGNFKETPGHEDQNHTKDSRTDNEDTSAFSQFKDMKEKYDNILGDNE